MRAWVWVLLGACAPPDPGSPDLPEPGQGLTVVATSSDDYTVGALTVVGQEDHVIADVAAIHADAVLSVEPDPDQPGQSIVWEINRQLGDTVRRYTPGVWDRPVWETSVGAGANPHDAATCQGRLFVSVYERDQLVILSPETGEHLGTVDLSPVADDDGLPEVSGLFVRDDVLYAVAQRLDRDHAWSTAPGGLLVAIHCVSGVVIDSWPLGRNPELGADGLPSFASEDGVRTFVDGTPSEVQLTDVDGAAVLDVAVNDAGHGAVIARDGSRHRVACVDATVSPWSVRTLPWMEHYISDVAVLGERAWFAVRRGWSDPTEAGGLMVVDLTTCTLEGDDWLRPRWAPFSLGFVPCVGDGCVADAGATDAL